MNTRASKWPEYVDFSCPRCGTRNSQTPRGGAFRCQTCGSSVNVEDGATFLVSTPWIYGTRRILGPAFMVLGGAAMLTTIIVGTDFFRHPGVLLCRAYCPDSGPGWLNAAFPLGVLSALAGLLLLRNRRRPKR